MMGGGGGGSSESWQSEGIHVNDSTMKLTLPKYGTTGKIDNGAFYKYILPMS